MTPAVASAPVLALTGATGFVGSAALDQALAAGWHVRALTRRPQAARDGVTWVSGALDDPASLAQLVDGANAVLHIAGVVSAPDLAGFRAGNIDAVQNMLLVSQQAHIRRFIHISSLSAREPALSQYGWSKARSEDLVKASPLDWTIIRPPAVFGPRDTEMLDLFRMAQRGLQFLPPPGRMSGIFVTDLARLLVRLADDSYGLSFGAVYEPDDGRRHGWTHREFADAIADAVGKKIWLRLTSNAFLLNNVARLDMMFRGKKAKLTRDRAAYIAHPDWVVSHHARPPASLWQAQYLTPDALAETAEWYRAEKWL